MAGSTSPSTPPIYIMLVQVFYLLVLFAMGLIYVTNLNMQLDALLHFKIPDFLGSLPVGVPWFGALGAVIISLSGIAFNHRKDWDSSWNFWHFSRPLIGATMAIIAVITFQAGILAVASSPTPQKGVTPNLLYYLIAFVVGYREQTFRDLLKRVADVILSPSGGASPPVSRALPTVTSINPIRGSTSGGTSVIITGTGFTGATAVNFGSKAASSFNVDSDTQITAVSPTTVGSGAIDVTVVAPGGTSTTGAADVFTYT